MTDVYQLLIKGDRSRKSLASLVDAVSEASDFELDQAAEGLDDSLRGPACVAVADRFRGHNTLSKLELGALLYLFLLVTDGESRGSQFKSMEEETGIKRTQLYDHIRKYRLFGRKLLAAPETAARCVSGALTILSGESVPEEARDEAIAYASAGNRLTIKEAKAIQRKHANRSVSEMPNASANDAKPNADGTGRSTRSTTSKNALWKFAAANVRIVIQPSTHNAVVGGEDIVLALEAALEKARRDYVSAETDQQLQLA